jgi:hypothetical protein
MNIAELQAYVSSLSQGDREALEDDGLCLVDSLSPAGYDSSLSGYLPFAYTGGDGVHFSIPSDQSFPVVMTVPMVFDCPNVVVGSDLEDFLSLGCVYGYFGLEQLAYNEDRTVDYIQAANEPSSALQRLTKHFNLRPWQGVGDRLAALKLAHPLGTART